MSTCKKYHWLVISSVLVLFAFLIVAITVKPIVVSAYGGGSGFPPGLPTYNIAVVCTNKIMKLPFNINVTVPQCAVRKDQDFNQRLRDFVNRVIHGDNR
jgi:hypothetical protein